MQLNDYLQSPSFKKYLDNPNYFKIIKYIIFYNILFNEDAEKIDELLARINDSNIENNYINIITNKLMSKNDNKKKIYTNLFEKLGNLKYEISTSNNTSYFDNIISLLKKYDISVNPRHKRIISNNIDKILSIYPLLDNNISSIADLVLGTNKVIYVSKDYLNIKKHLLEFLKEKNVSLLDTTLISYNLDRYYLADKCEIIVTNNIEVTKDLIEDCYNYYKTDINSFFSYLLNDKKEKKAVNTEELMRIELPYEENPKVLEEYLINQEKIKTIQEEEINKLSEKKGILEGNIEK